MMPARSARPIPAIGNRRRAPLISPRTLVLASGAATLLLLLLVSARALLVPHHHPPATPTTAVFVTTTSVPAHMPITPEVARPVPMRLLEIPKHAVTSPMEFAGMVTKEVIPPQTVITRDHLMPVAEAEGLARQLPDGSDAVTILLPEIEAGRVVAGDTIDVLATFAQAAAGQTRQSPITVWAATNARVLAVTPIKVPAPPAGPGGQARGDPNAQIPTVALTLQADPAEVPTLMLGYHTGRLAIAVLPQNGTATVPDTGVSLAAIAARLIPAPEKPATEPTHTQPAPPRVIQMPVIPTPPPQSAAPRPAAPTHGGEPPLHRVEVILGSTVRLELVPLDGQGPSEQSVRSRSERTQPGSGPQFVPMPPPPEAAPPAPSAPGQATPPPVPQGPPGVPSPAYPAPSGDAR